MGDERLSGSRQTAAARLVTWDYVAIAIYFLLVLGVGLSSLFRKNRGTVSGYFLAGRFMWWLPVGASLFASNIGSEHFIGLAGSGAASGFGVGAFEVNAILLLQVLGWLFLPVFIASRASTLPEYMRKRFGGDRIRVYLACLSIALYVFTKISVNLYAGALFIRLALGWNIYLSIFFLLFVTMISTITGGLAAVIYTDTLQTFIMIIGSVFLTAVSFREVGGFSNMLTLYGQAVAVLPSNSTTPPHCAQPPKNYDVMLRGVGDNELPWLGFFLGQTPASIWYWCSDQMMVQRTLAAKSLSHAQGATIFAGYLKVLPFFILVLPGMVARVLFTDEVTCADPVTCQRFCGSETSCTNMAYPYLVLRLMPPGVKGVMLAVILAALMSDLTSIFNSASTLFTIDIYRKFRKRCSVRELMIVGRLFVLVMIGVSVIWIPVIDKMQGGQLYLYIQAISSNLAPPIASVYLLAILWKRTNEQGAFWGLMLGLLLSFIRLTLEFAFPAPQCGEEDLRPVLTKNFHYMYFAVLLFWTTTLTAIVVSLVTEPSSDNMLIRTTYWSRFDERKRDDDALNAEAVPCYQAETKEFKLKTIGATKASEKNESDSEVDMAGTDLSVQSKIANRREPAPSHSMIRRCFTLVLRQLKRMASWFCGLQPEDSERANQQKERLENISSLHQHPKAKLFLNINVFVVILLGIFMFIFFSIPRKS